MSDSGTTTESTDPVDTALRLGMCTEALPTAALARIRRATEAQWRSMTGVAGRGRSWLRHATAATIGMLLLAGGWMVGTRSPDAPLSAAIGRLERIDYPGVVEQRRWSQDRSLASGEPLRAGQRILVRGGARLALAGAGSLRLAAGTDFKVESDHLVRLTDGDIYVDIPPERSTAVQLAILTPAGTFTHLGTQFQLTVHGGQTRLRVREGQVRWRSATRDTLSGPGTQLSIDQKGNATLEHVATAGADWAWAEALAAGFDIENRPLMDFLHYVARETGRALVFPDAATQSRAATVVLHGSMRDLTAVEALATVMATTSLRFTLDQNFIRIEPGAP